MTRCADAFGVDDPAEALLLLVELDHLVDHERGVSRLVLRVGDGAPELRAAGRVGVRQRIVGSSDHVAGRRPCLEDVLVCDTACTQAVAEEDQRIRGVLRVRWGVRDRRVGRGALRGVVDRGLERARRSGVFGGPCRVDERLRSQAHGVFPELRDLRRLGFGGHRARGDRGRGGDDPRREQAGHHCHDGQTSAPAARCSGLDHRPPPVIGPVTPPAPGASQRRAGRHHGATGRPRRDRSSGNGRRSRA